jgi:uncharacterized protein YjbJ (UPF0337 family)
MDENELKGAARELGGKAQEGLGEILGTPEDQIAGKIKQVAGQAQRAYGDTADEVSDYVRNQPLTALLMAAGVGFLLGVLLVRR